MATIDSKEQVEKIITKPGKVVKIVQYNNMFDGRLAYGLIERGEDLQRYHNSAACRNPITIWERK